MGTDLRRAGDRFRTATDWLDSRHSFSFGRHYDPDNTHFGVLLVNNDDVVKAGTGFETHPHRDMEIITWVLEGSLVHQDSTGHNGLVRPGLVQRMSAGTGILHSEKNDSAGDLHLVQMWVQPDTERVTPGYAQRDINADLESGELVVVASGRTGHRGERAISIHQRHASLHAARLRPGTTAALPTSPMAHVFVARGDVELEGAGPMATGDAARITDTDGQRVHAGPDGAEVLVWEVHATLG